MNSRAMRRDMRSARAVLQGERILAFVRAPKTQRLLVKAAEEGAPPVTAISRQLLELIGRDAKLVPVRQFSGLCVRAVLEEQGFEIAETGVRVSKDPIFRTASTYRRISTEKRNRSEDLLARLIETFTDEEVETALSLLRLRTK